MKKKILKLMILLMTAASLSGLMFQKTVKAEENATLSQIVITQYPAKTTYSQGEDLKLSDMVVTGYYIDGTSSTITDYQVSGYDSSILGTQNVYITYGYFTTAFAVTVVPAKVTNISVSSHSTNFLALTWDAMPGISSYEIYERDELTGSYNLVSVTASNSVAFNYLPGSIHTYQICSVGYYNGLISRGELSDPFTAATNPEAATGLSVNQTSTTQITLSWAAAAGATGYAVYRSPASSSNYTFCGTSLVNSFTDKSLASGTSYKYKVCAYAFDIQYSGVDSGEVYTSTNPAVVKVHYKAGDQKIRFSWSKVTGADSYDIYISEDGLTYNLLTTNKGNTNCSYLLEGLVTGNTYYFYAVAHRTYNGALYDSPASELSEITMTEIEATSTIGKFFVDETAFKNSWAYLKLPSFAKIVNYKKSAIIPGLSATNVGGFLSTSMCPQGITFADDYLLMTAYDIANEENSVIYVMDKTTKELLTTLILPSKTHAGGLGFDGTNLWIPTGTRISSVPITVVDEAVASGAPYSWIDYNTTITLGITASYITYYADKLWVGSYNELSSTNMYSYTIEDIDTVPTLCEADTIVMPTRVQGAAFTENGTLILSRSCQLYKGLRGYMRQLDVYRPDFANAADGIIPLGEVINTVAMPSMNEDITISGSYLYVNFESGAFEKSSYKMDRICAFKLTSITKKTVK